MSERVSLHYAARIAGRLLELLAESCERLEVAGSIRRGKETVKDIELVAVPKFLDVRDMFGQVTRRVNLLEQSLGGMVAAGALAVPAGVKNAGERMKKYDLARTTPVMRLDLFIVLPPAQWGSVFTIRTGPGDFSKWLVTARRFGGGMPDGMVQLDGALYRDGQVVETPEERDYFAALGLPWLEPKKREQWATWVQEVV